MKPKLSWPIFWLGVAFIAACLAVAVTGYADNTCEEERKTAKLVCRKYGRDTKKCDEALEELRWCEIESGSDDPLKGLYK